MQIKTLTSLAIAAIISSAHFTTMAQVIEMPRVEGEIARPNAVATKAAARLPLLGSAIMQADFASIELPAMDVTKIDAIKKSNSVDGVKKWAQIGLSRLLRDELPSTDAVRDLRWKRIAAGGKVAYLRVKSNDAKAIRVGLNVLNAPQGLELRLIGADHPSKVVALADATELNTLKDANGIYWTPITDGEYQLIEISLPANVATNTFAFAVDAISHIFATPSQKFADAKVATYHESCLVDVACATPTPGFVNAKNAVAQLIFQVKEGTGYYTGTLLNDNDPTTQIPYILSSNTGLGTQAVANTLNTRWFTEGIACPRAGDFSDPSPNSVLVTGGAKLIFSDLNNDSALFQLNNAPPAGAFFLGWDSNAVKIGENISVIHAASYSSKFIALGVVDNYASYLETFRPLTGSFISPRYTSSTTAGGSFGAGLLTEAGGSYFFRGSLIGGPANCLNTGLPAANGNYDYYSRFDQIFPAVRPYLFKEAIGTNYTDIWWGGESESGWGIQITQHRSKNIFATWYTYDQSGNQLFIVMSGCDVTPFSNNTCSGRLYRTTGTPFNEPNFSGASTTLIGTGTFTFIDTNNATFDYTINASATNPTTTIRKKITRFPFGSGIGAYPNDHSDIYYKADAAGWGYSLAQHGNDAFGVIYHYDENRNPMFLTMYMPVFNATYGGTNSATLYRSRSNGGSHYLTPTWRASDISNVPFAGSGSGAISMVPDGLNMTFVVNSNGVNYIQTRRLTRVPF